MGHLVFALALSVVVGLCSARHFELTKEGSGDLCILLDVSFNIEVKAISKEDEDVVLVKTLTPDDMSVEGKGVCDGNKSAYAVFFNKKSEWSISFESEDKHPVAMYRIFNFNPSEIFGSAVNATDFIGFSDPRPVYLKDKSHSYKCGNKDALDYVLYTPVESTKYTFAVRVTVFDIHTQGLGVNGGEFGPPEVCIAPVPGPSPKPVTHVPASTTAPHPVTHVKPTTPPGPITHVPPTQVPVPGPHAPVNTYNVMDGEVPCITMETTITIVIEYPTTTPKKYKTATVNVPKDARASGNCKVSKTSQVLSIGFLNGWELKFTFSKGKQLENKAGEIVEPSYRISNITLLVVVDKRIFPDSQLGEHARYTEVPDSKTPDFPKKSASSNYYRCNSKTVNVLKKGVKVDTTHLRFKAFNTDKKAGFYGSGTVCGSDHHVKSQAGMIVGILITIIVVIAVAVFAGVMIFRRRKGRYENIQ